MYVVCVCASCIEERDGFEYGGIFAGASKTALAIARGHFFVDLWVQKDHFTLTKVRLNGVL